MIDSKKMKKSLVSITSKDDIFARSQFPNNFRTCPFGSWVSSGKLLCIRWCMWSNINISDQESCNSFIWSSTWKKKTSISNWRYVNMHKVSHLDFRFDLTNRYGQNRIALSTEHLYGLHHLERKVVGPLDVLNSPEYRNYTYKSLAAYVGIAK